MPIAIIPLEGADIGEKAIYNGESRIARVTGITENGREYTAIRAKVEGTQDGGTVEIDIPEQRKYELHNQAIILKDISPRIKIVGFDKEHAFDEKLFGRHV